MKHNHKEEYKFISTYKDIDTRMWDEFVTTHPKGNFFYSKEFYYSLKGSDYYDAVFAARINPENNQIRGLLVATIQREHPGILNIFTSRCIIYGEPLAINDDFEVQVSLIGYLENVIKPKVILTQYRFFVTPSSELFKYLEDAGYIYEPYLNIINNTSAGLDHLWNGIERRRKQNIKKAQTYNFSFRLADYEENIDVFYALLCETYETIKGLHPSKDYFLSLKQNVGKNVFKLFELRLENNVIVSFIGFLSKGILYAHYIGNKKEKKMLLLRPVDLFYWELLKWCNENGVKYFNWLGAGHKNKDYGVRDFKLKFGGDVFEPGRMKKYGNLVIKITFNLALAVWKKLK